jgi:hypothetical protein
MSKILISKEFMSYSDIGEKRITVGKDACLPKLANALFQEAAHPPHLPQRKLFP